MVQHFKGRMSSHSSTDSYVASLQVDDDHVRIWNEHRRIGAWPIGDVHCERVTVFRFQLTLDGVVHTFQPDDPAGFADGMGAVIDLRPTTRFGLGPRVRAAKEEILAARAAREGEPAD